MSECQFYAGNLHAKLDRIIALLEKMTTEKTAHQHVTGAVAESSMRAIHEAMAAPKPLPPRARPLP